MRYFEKANNHYGRPVYGVEMEAGSGGEPVEHKFFPAPRADNGYSEPEPGEWDVTAAGPENAIFGVIDFPGPLYTTQTAEVTLVHEPSGATYFNRVFELQPFDITVPVFGRFIGVSSSDGDTVYSAITATLTPSSSTGPDHTVYIEATADGDLGSMHVVYIYMGTEDYNALVAEDMSEDYRRQVCLTITDPTMSGSSSVPRLLDKNGPVSVDDAMALFARDGVIQCIDGSFCKALGFVYPETPGEAGYVSYNNYKGCGELWTAGEIPPPLPE